MKSVLISIQPKYVELIASGEKTIEVRKTRPKLDTPFKCYIYCTMGKLPKYIYNKNLEKESVYKQHPDIINGKVIGEFICDRIEDFSQWQNDYSSLLRHINLYAGTNGDYKFLDDYLKGKKDGYGWHISDLKIYDKPKELGEFRKEMPPQSWCYVEEKQDER